MKHNRPSRTVQKRKGRKEENKRETKQRQTILLKVLAAQRQCFFLAYSSPSRCECLSPAPVTSGHCRGVAFGKVHSVVDHVPRVGGLSRGEVFAQRGLHAVPLYQLILCGSVVISASSQMLKMLG